MLMSGIFGRMLHILLITDPPPYAPAISCGFCQKHCDALLSGQGGEAPCGVLRGSAPEPSETKRAAGGVVRALMWENKLNYFKEIEGSF